MKYFYLFVILFVCGISVNAQLQLVPNSFQQVSNLDEADPNKWKDTDSHLLTKQEKYDNNGVANALVKLKVDRISQDDLQELNFLVDQGVECVWIRQGQTPGEMWLLISGVTTAFSVRHPNFGESNQMQLDLKGERTYVLNLTNGQTTTLTINSNPINANVYLDGDWKGKTTDNGLNLSKVSFGKHQLRVVLDNVSKNEEIEVSDGSLRSYSFDVNKERDFEITSDPVGAVIYVDGMSTGKVTPATIRLSLTHHKIEVRKDGEFQHLTELFTEDMPNTLPVLVVRKHKKIQIAAQSRGADVSASVHIDKELVGTTTHTEEISYGKHELMVTYNNKQKVKSIKVNDNSDTYYRFKFSSRNNFTWPWEKEYEIYPVGLSVGYIQKEYAFKYKEGGEDKSDFWGEDKFMHGIQAGIRFQPMFKYGFGLSLGLFYEYYFDKSEDTPVEDDYGNFNAYGKYDEHSLAIPLNLEYRIPLSETFSIFINGGIGVDIGLAGKISLFDTSDDSEPYYTDKKIYNSDTFATQKRFNISYMLGGGLQFKCVQLSFNMSRGLLNHSSDEAYTMKVNKPMMLSLSYVFNGN